MIANSLIDRCREAVGQLVDAYRWKLISSDALIEEVCERALAENVSTTTELKKLAINIYSIALFTACHDANQREKAMIEIAEMFSRRVGNKYSDMTIRTMIIQDALTRIWEDLDACQSPGTFLYFCGLRLRHAETDFQREEKRSLLLQPLPEADEQISESHFAVAGDSVMPNIDEDECLALRVRILERFGELYQKLTRAQTQLEAVFEVYFRGMKLAEASSNFDTTINHFGVLLHRGRAKLKNDAVFIELLREFVLNCKGLEFDALYS